MKLVKNNSLVFDSGGRLILNASTGPVRGIEAKMSLGITYITYRGISKENEFINDNRNQTGINENVKQFHVVKSLVKEVKHFMFENKICVMMIQRRYKI